MTCEHPSKELKIVSIRKVDDDFNIPKPESLPSVPIKVEATCVCHACGEKVVIT